MSRKFWRNFCDGVGRSDLFERWPGAEYGDHARGNLELRAELGQIFASRTTAEWIAFGLDHNTTIAPVNTPQTIGDDPQFEARLPWIPRELLEADMLPYPARFEEGGLPVPERAPSAGEHTDAILTHVAGYEPDRIRWLRQTGAVQ